MSTFWHKHCSQSVRAGLAEARPLAISEAHRGPRMSDRASDLAASTHDPGLGLAGLTITVGLVALRQTGCRAAHAARFRPEAHHPRPPRRARRARRRLHRPPPAIPKLIEQLEA